MRVLFLGNNWLGWKALEWLEAEGEEIVGVVLHPPERRKYGEEIIATAHLGLRNVFDGSRLGNVSVLEAIRALNMDIGISVLFGYVLRKEFLDLIPLGCLNVHPALLPYNRGAYPNVWSIVEGTPAGVTIHYIDEGVDTGDIVAQRQVLVEPVDTGESLYHKLEEVALDLLKETWPLVRSGHAPRIPQDNQRGTCHRVKDVEQIDQIDLDRNYSARELINIIRARTFSPYPGAHFYDRDRKVYMRLQLFYEDQFEGQK